MPLVDTGSTLAFRGVKQSKFSLDLLLDLLRRLVQEEDEDFLEVEVLFLDELNSIDSLSLDVELVRDLPVSPVCFLECLCRGGEENLADFFRDEEDDAPEAPGDFLATLRPTSSNTAEDEAEVGNLADDLFFVLPEPFDPELDPLDVAESFSLTVESRSASSFDLLNLAAEDLVLEEGLSLEDL